ncbi:MAG: polysaccharide biosynthesis tyrosine autokinase [Acidobacteriota bacterium]
MANESDLSLDKPRETENTGLNLDEYWAVIVKRRRLIILTVLLALTAAAVASVITKPLYKATALLKVERQQGSPVDLGDNYRPWDPDFLPTQRDLMGSREVAERVVRKLHLTDNAEFVPQRSEMFGGKKAAPAAELAAIEVQKSIETVPRRGTSLVELSVVQPDPKLAADIANAVVQAYIDWNIESKFLVVGEASRFLTTQIDQLKGELAAKEKELQAYGRQKEIVSTDPNSNATMQKLESFNKDYAAAVADRVGKEARYYELQNARPETIADNLSSGLVSQLRNDQAKLERDYAEKLSIYKPSWPAMQQARAQIDKNKQNLASVIDETVAKARDNARTEYQTALRREQSLKGVLQGQTSEAMTLNSNAVEYNNLQTEVQTKRALLDTLLKRHAETEVTSRLRGETMSNIQVVDRALTPRYRFRPSYRLNAVFGLLAGTFLGFGLAFFIEYIDRSLRSAEQVERTLNVPGLGVIPSLGSGGSALYGDRSRRRERKLEAAGAGPVQITLLPHLHPRSTVAEAYRSFRTSLLLSRAGGLRTIVITSAMPGEGKTTTSSNLAIVLAQLGKRVLLVDADLHKARIHEIFAISNRVGLVSLLAENADPVSITVPTAIPGLFVIPAGPSSPNPSGLLSSEAMRLFLERSATEFDYIILDTPPVGPVADAIILGNQADGVVLCVLGGKTPRDRVRRVRDRLSRSNVRLLGVLLNNLEHSAAEYREYYGEYEAAGYGEKLPTRAAIG